MERFDDRELRNLTAVLASGRLDDSRRRGEFNRRLERGLGDRLGARFACTVSSATAGLHMALMATGVGPGDTVAVDPLVKFGAVATLHCGATPLFVDVDPESFLIDLQMLRRTLDRRPRAIICTALLGFAPPMDEILDIARARGIVVIEDCSQAIGARTHGRCAGTLGDVGVFSFHASKHLSTGDGGLVVTGDERIFDAIVQLREHGWHPNPHLRSRRVGWNYRMTELAAAVGVAQSEKIDAILEHHRAAAAIVTAALKGVPWLRPQKTDPESAPVYWKWAASVDPMMLGPLRDRLSGGTAVKFGLYPGGPAYLRPALSSRCAAGRGACPVAEHLSENALVLDISYSKSLEFFEEAVGAIASASVDCERAIHAR